MSAPCQGRGRSLIRCGRCRHCAATALPKRACMSPLVRDDDGNPTELVAPGRLAPLQVGAGTVPGRCRDMLF